MPNITGISDKIGLTNFAIYIIILILGIGITYGTTTFRINTLEDKTNKYQDDHVLIIILNTKLDQLATDVKEIKSDLRDLKNRKN